MRIPVAIVGLLLLTGACTSDVPPSTSATEPRSSQVNTLTPTPSALPVTDIESFVTALGSAGFKVNVGPIVIPPGYGGFGRRAQKVTIDGYEVWAFQFSTVSAYHRMRSKISDNGQHIGNYTFAWTPHIYGSGRLIVLYVGNRGSGIRDALDDLMGKQFAGV
jgi:hypothetical protein